MYYNNAFPDPSFKKDTAFTLEADRIAERPSDVMGEEFYATFGAYLKTVVPSSVNMRIITQDAFILRLDLAKKYNTYFAEQMEPKGRPLWLERFNGKGATQAWSFGIKEHARAGLLFEWLEDEYNHRPSTKATLPEPVVVPLTAVSKGTEFDSWKVSPSGRVLRYNETAFLIDHGPNHSMPSCVNQIEKHWKAALAPTNKPLQRMQHTAALEWKWYWANPYGRAGALTGDVLSLSLQQRLKDEGHTVQMRNKFYSQDLEAFCYPLADYITKRVQDLKFGAKERPQNYRVTLLDQQGGVRTPVKPVSPLPAMSL